MARRKLKKKQHPATAGAARSKPEAAAAVSPNAMLLDHHDKQLVIFTDDMLLNQLRRDGLRIEASFDKLCEQDLRELSQLLSTTLGLLYSGLKVALRCDQKLKTACGQLLLNAANSFGAATALLRMGYVLQPGIVIRSILEAVSTTLHLLQRPGDLAAYENHLLQSPKTLAAARKVLPPLGQLYGHFSDNFAHIGRLHKSVTPVTEFKERHPALEANLSSLRIIAWLLYVTTELLFNELLDAPRYWHPVVSGYAYNPSAAERAWMASFLGLSNAA
jgi:hypothetical protein